VPRPELRARLERKIGETLWIPEPRGEAVLESIAERLPDARFPGALLRSGDRVLPVVTTLSPPCAGCDGKGSIRCTRCRGTGIVYFTPQSGNGEDDEFPCGWCDERRQAPHANCYATGFSSAIPEWWKRSKCRHRKWQMELAFPAWCRVWPGMPGSLKNTTFKRCLRCHLARCDLREACGTCGCFTCSCGPSDAFPFLAAVSEVIWFPTRPKGAFRAEVAGRALKLLPDARGFHALHVDGKEVAQVPPGAWAPGWRLG
jgi:hypothetical protein